MLQSNTPPNNEQHTFFGFHCTLIKQPCHQYKTDPFHLSFSKHLVGMEEESWHGRHCTLLYVYHMLHPCQCQQVKGDRLRPHPITTFIQETFNLCWTHSYGTRVNLLTFTVCRDSSLLRSKLQFTAKPQNYAQLHYKITS